MLRITLTESAQAAARTKNTYFASQHARIKGRLDHKKAIVAIAHAILVTVYHMLRTGRTYADLGITCCSDTLPTPITIASFTSFSAWVFGVTLTPVAA